MKHDAAPEVPHPRPTRRDTATRWGRHCPRVLPHRATWIPRVFSWLAPTRADAAPTQADSCKIWLTRAWIGRIGRNGRFRPKLKKKKVQNTPFDLYLNPTSTQFTQTPKHKLSWNVLVSILWVVFNLWKSCFSYYLLLLLNLVYVCIMWKSMLSNILKI